jgi:hypothetical protein
MILLMNFLAIVRQLNYTVDVAGMTGKRPAQNDEGET